MTDLEARYAAMMRKKKSGLNDILRERVNELHDDGPDRYIKHAIFHLEEHGGDSIRLHGIKLKGDSECVNVFSKYLVSNKTVVKVDLSNNELNEIQSESFKGTTAIANAIRENTSIEAMNLTRNFLTANGEAWKFFDALQANNTLRVLNLSNNSFGRYWETLAVIPDQNKKMQGLVPAGSTVAGESGWYTPKDGASDPASSAAPAANSWGYYRKGPGGNWSKIEGQYVYSKDGIEHLATTLQMNRSLVHLDLGNNYLFDEGGKLVLEALKSKSYQGKLQVLDLGGNFINQQILGELHDACTNHNIKLIADRKPLGSTPL